MWAVITNTILGVWVMISPTLLEYDKKAANNNYIVGPIEITFAIIAIWEVNRSARFFNIAAGAWLALSPLILGFSSQESILNNAIAGVVIAGLSMIRGEIKGRYGGGWRSLIRPDQNI
jgi:hypothetical protein